MMFLSNSISVLNSVYEDITWKKHRETRYFDSSQNIEEEDVVNDVSLEKTIEESKILKEIEKERKEYINGLGVKPLPMFEEEMELIKELNYYIVTSATEIYTEIYIATIADVFDFLKIYDDTTMFKFKRFLDGRFFIMDMIDFNSSKDIRTYIGDFVKNNLFSYAKAVGIAMDVRYSKPDIVKIIYKYIHNEFISHLKNKLENSRFLEEYNDIKLYDVNGGTNESFWTIEALKDRYGVIGNGTKKQI